jgi:hypothetical protein
MLDITIEFFALAFGLGLLGVVIKELRAYYKLKQGRLVTNVRT